IAAFYLLIGYGVGVMLLAAWLVAGVVLADRMWRRTAGDVDTGAGDAGARPDDAGPAIEETLVRLLLFGLILLLYRLFTSRYQDNLSGAALTDHFALFSFLAGAMLPGLLARAGAGTGGVTHMGGPAAQVIRFAVAVVLAAGVPAAMLVLWGARSAVGLLAGLAVAAAATEITGAGGAHPAAGRAALRISIMAMLCAVVLTQTAGYAIPLSTLTRAEKTRMLTALAAGVVAVMVLGDIASRIASWTRRKGQGAIHPSPEGAER
ncbi:MAG: hypothetical protein HY660_16405, partial [Armatimonadetes bacterium]|nr:hypothetical protein [Armatimonadota bacterium]